MFCAALGNGDGEEPVPGSSWIALPLQLLRQVMTSRLDITDATWCDSTGSPWACT